MHNPTIQLASCDPVLAQLIRVHSPQSLQKHTDYYGQLVKSIIGQQISTHAANAILRRFLAVFDGAFPTPEQVMLIDSNILASAGLGKMKTRYIQDLAAKIIDRTVTFDQFDEMPNEVIVEKLTQVNGIGEWTAHMFLIFSMARHDVLPTDDLGIRKGVATLYGLTSPASKDEVVMTAKANKWHPYESIACLYIWKSLEKTLPQPSTPIYN